MNIKVPVIPEGALLDIGPDARVEILNITEHMEKHLGRMAYWYALAESALQDQKDVKHQLLCMQEDIDGELRKKYESASKKLTVDQLKAMINRDPRVRKLFARHRRRSRDAGMLKVFAEIMKAKKDLLQSLGALSRAEREGEVKTYNKVYQAKVRNQQGAE